MPLGTIAKINRFCADGNILLDVETQDRQKLWLVDKKEISPLEE